MAATPVLAVDQQWAGDRKRHLVVVGFGTGVDGFSAAQVGLKNIETIIPIARVGTWNCAGETVTTVNPGTLSYVLASGSTVETCTVQTAGITLLQITGW